MITPMSSCLRTYLTGYSDPHAVTGSGRDSHVIPRYRDDHHFLASPVEKPVTATFEGRVYRELDRQLFNREKDRFCLPVKSSLDSSEDHKTCSFLHRSPTTFLISPGGYRPLVTKPRTSRITGGYNKYHVIGLMPGSNLEYQ